ncbi:hypothetical protein CYMTET_55454 [Cymbomonas tetramitiformis]|uniref:Uncharacterized protein n=1 Tax=Cymbomonas tetramitiformis TaxID=36881 RepID=A0AAE0BE28_9CHLO|nr:hypothetical protein CYMTET_55454 [Cymbomonas tetramitiformis]|eukprot:gene14081-16647_t
MFNWKAVAFRLKAQIDEANSQLSEFVRKFYLRGYVVHKELVASDLVSQLERAVILLEEEYLSMDVQIADNEHKKTTAPASDDSSDEEGNNDEGFERPPGDVFVKANANRRHVLLREPAATLLISSMLGSQDLVDLLRSHLGNRVRVVEAAAISVSCDAKHQAWHWDNEYEPQFAKIVTVFVALQDISPTMGPIEMIYYDGKWHRETVGVVGLGDAVVMESTTIHRGSKHSGGPPRRVAYASFMSLRGSPPDGPVYAIREQMQKTEINLDEREVVFTSSEPSTPNVA